MRISDWSSDVCSSDLIGFGVSGLVLARVNPVIYRARSRFQPGTKGWDKALLAVILPAMVAILPVAALDAGRLHWSQVPLWLVAGGYAALLARSEEHTSELQSLMRISYAVFCLKKKNKK